MSGGLLISRLCSSSLSLQLMGVFSLKGAFKLFQCASTVIWGLTLTATPHPRHMIPAAPPPVPDLLS